MSIAAVGTLAAAAVLAPVAARAQELAEVDACFGEGERLTAVVRERLNRVGGAR